MAKPICYKKKWYSTVVESKSSLKRKHWIIGLDGVKYNLDELSDKAKVRIAYKKKPSFLDYFDFLTPRFSGKK